MAKKSEPEVPEEVTRSLENAISNANLSVTAVPEAVIEKFSPPPVDPPDETPHTLSDVE